MQYSIAVVAAVAGMASAYAAPPAYNSSSIAAYTTEVVTAYTTFCPQATEITHGGVTYTATEATTLTITNCPCTVTKPATSSVVTECSTCATPYSSTWAPVSSSAVVVPYPSQNATSAVPTTYPSGTVGPQPSTTAPVNAGNKAFAATGAGILAVVGLVAAL